MEDESEKSQTVAIGDIAPAGHPRKGFIYAGISPEDQRPLWVSPYAPTTMNYFEAAAWARERDGYLPTCKQGVYIASNRDKGALKDLFNRNSDECEGWAWLTDFRPDIYPSVNMWAFAADDGDQASFEWNAPLAVLCVRR